MKTIPFRGLEFDSAGEAIQWACASGLGEAILLDGRHYVVKRDEAERLAAAGVEFAYLHDHEMPDGSRRIVTVPVTD
jgi:hypothetical protein